MDVGKYELKYRVIEVQHSLRMVDKLLYEMPEDPEELEMTDAEYRAYRDGMSKVRSVLSFRLDQLADLCDVEDE